MFNDVSYRSRVSNQVKFLTSLSFLRNVDKNITFKE